MKTEKPELKLVGNEENKEVKEQKELTPKENAIGTLANICMEYVNTLNQTGKQVSANLIVQSANQAILILQKD